jgi:glycine/D-amino acid oxidase-like deaminating enzyme
VVITAGPWSQSLLADLGLSFVIRRIPQLWFRLQPSAGSRANTPCFSVKLPYGEFYGVPTLDGSLMKVCGGAERAVVKHATHLDRQLRPEDTREVGRFIRECLPGVESQPSDYSMCMATMTPDESFVVDRHPRSPRIVFAAGFSGHGFKFTPAIGELVADMVTWNAASSPNFMCLRPQLEAAQSTLLQ